MNASVIFSFSNDQNYIQSVFALVESEHFSRGIVTTTSTERDKMVMYDKTMQTTRQLVQRKPWRVPL